MCTVTLTAFPGTPKGFILTSNRDEAGAREALPPKFYNENGVKLLYPKDKLGGGSWIGISDRLRVVCLLNGGFVNHKRNPPYRLSRGVVLKDLLIAENLLTAIDLYDLQNVEPFTAVSVEWAIDLVFLEFVWDGTQKHIKHLDENHKHLWSSSPLYSARAGNLRKEWFSDFQKTTALFPDALWEFHHSAGIGDKNIDVIMDRGFIKTQSITQVLFDGNEINMRYEDLNSGRVSIKVMEQE